MTEAGAAAKRVVIIDDEPSAVRHLRSVLGGFDELDIVGEAGDGHSAIALITAQRPDIVFLDIEMPEVNGFEVARETQHLNYQLVFVTAFDGYALDAFDTNAIDYLMKPVRPSVLQKCIRKMLFQEGLALEAIEKASTTSSLTLSDGTSTRVLAHEHVCYIEGIGRYRRIHLSTGGAAVHRTETVVSDTTLDDFEQQLPPRGFIRLHRSYIVNTAKIVRIFAQERRHYVRLLDMTPAIPVSRNKVNELKSIL